MNFTARASSGLKRLGASDGDRCFLTMDHEIAFNQMDRPLPSPRDPLGGWQDTPTFCNANESFVLFGPEKIPNERGVQP